MLSFFKGSSLQVLLTKVLNSTSSFVFQNLSFHYLLSIRLFNLTLNCINAILAYFPMSQSNHYNIMIVSIHTGEYFIRPSAQLWLGQCVLIMYNRVSAKMVISLYKIYIYFLFPPHPLLYLTHPHSPLNALHLLLVYIIYISAVHSNTGEYMEDFQIQRDMMVI